MKRRGVFRGEFLGAAFVAAALSCTGCSPPAPATSGGPSMARLLTEAQYRNIIADVFGTNIVVAARFDPIDRADGLIADGASRAAITPAAFERYDALARGIAAQVIDAANRPYVLSCTPAAENAPDDACAGQTYREIGRVLFRRPLTDNEVKLLVGFANQSTASLGGFYPGLAAGLAVLLESPEFLYIQERTEPDPKHAGLQRLNAYGMASRLSFFLWNTTPDDTLLTAAEHGELYDQAGLERQVSRMLVSPRLEDGIRALFTDVYALDKADSLEKDTAIYPAFLHVVATDAREQTLRTIVQTLLVEKRDYRDVFTTRETFMSPSLGVLYDVPVTRPEGGWSRFTFAQDDPRAGIVGQLSFMALHSHPGKSSPTLRGRAVRELLLCQKIPDPPADVKFDKFNDTKSGIRTVRERLTAHATDAENGATIDVAGDLNGRQFTGAEGLGQALHGDPAAAACIVTKTYQYAAGRAVMPGEREWITYLNQQFAASKYQFVDLLRRIAINPALYEIAPDASPPKASTASADGGKEPRS
jgi:hypothetical protein